MCNELAGHIFNNNHLYCQFVTLPLRIWTRSSTFGQATCKALHVAQAYTGIYTATPDKVVCI